MRKIVKQAEPKKWTIYRLTPGVDYKAKPELRQSLLQEQGYLCAYCMRRIPVKDYNSNETTRIDHILSREKHPEYKLDYHNMVICCPGAIDNNFHCDKQKGENDITFNLFDDHFFTTLSYGSKSGEIKSSVSAYDQQINKQLNLNNRLLKRNRQNALLGVIKYLNCYGWTISNINQQIKIWDNKDAEGYYKEYNSIILWYLRKKLKENK